ncbi:hypothetical protein VTN02DRAFT_4670 [Thermoascus thermophilus]
MTRTSQSPRPCPPPPLPFCLASRAGAVRHRVKLHKNTLPYRRPASPVYVTAWSPAEARRPVLRSASEGTSPVGDRVCWLKTKILCSLAEEPSPSDSACWRPDPRYTRSICLEAVSTPSTSICCTVDRFSLEPTTQSRSMVTDRASLIPAMDVTRLVLGRNMGLYMGVEFVL